jgi:hypothetical protein
MSGPIENTPSIRYHDIVDDLEALYSRTQMSWEEDVDAYTGIRTAHLQFRLPKALVAPPVDEIIHELPAYRYAHLRQELDVSLRLEQPGYLDVAGPHTVNLERSRRFCAGVGLLATNAAIRYTVGSHDARATPKITAQAGWHTPRNPQWLSRFYKRHNHTEATNLLAKGLYSYDKGRPFSIAEDESQLLTLRGMLQGLKKHHIRFYLEPSAMLYGHF